LQLPPVVTPFTAFRASSERSEGSLSMGKRCFAALSMTRLFMNLRLAQPLEWRL
jgi:hypothetical protein